MYVMWGTSWPYVAALDPHPQRSQSSVSSQELSENVMAHTLQPSPLSRTGLWE
jgi:hypothetical protein